MSAKDLETNFVDIDVLPEFVNMLQASDKSSYSQNAIVLCTKMLVARKKELDDHTALVDTIGTAVSFKNLRLIDTDKETIKDFENPTKSYRFRMDLIDWVKSLIFHNDAKATSSGIMAGGKSYVTYMAARTRAFFRGWISPFRNDELEVTTCAGKHECYTNTHTIADLDNIAKAVIGALEIAEAFLVAKALSWWLTNHNVGTSTITTVINKVLIIHKDVVLDSSVGAGAKEHLWKAFHFASNARIICSTFADVHFGNCRLYRTEYIPIPNKLISEDAIYIRTRSLPAGCHVIELAFQAANIIAPTNLLDAYPDKHGLLQVVEARRRIKLFPHLYHIGARVFFEDRSEFRRDWTAFVTKETAEKVLRDLVEYIELQFPAHTILRSPIVVRLKSNACDVAWATTCARVREAVSKAANISNDVVDAVIAKMTLSMAKPGELFNRIQDSSRIIDADIDRALELLKESLQASFGDEYVDELRKKVLAIKHDFDLTAFEDEVLGKVGGTASA